MSPSMSQPAARPLRGGWLALARLAWYVSAALALAYYLVLTPAQFAQVQAGLTPPQLDQLAALGLSAQGYALYLLALDWVFLLVCFAIGVLIFWRKSDERMALLAATMLVTFGTISFNETLAALPAALQTWRWALVTIYFVGDTTSFLLFYLFPDGRFVPRWMRWLAVVVIMTEVQIRFFPWLAQQVSWVATLNFGLTLSFLISIVVAQVYRYRRVSGPVERQQTRWVVFGLTIAVLGSPGVTLMAFLSGIRSSADVSVPLLLGINTVVTLSLLAIPISIGIAVLRYRLWDIDLILQRTLVYGALTGCVIGIYILVVGGLGALFQARGSPALALVATGVAAVLFQPLRERLQRGVSRLVYGERDDPYAVLTRLGERLETTLAPEAALPMIVETVAQALKAPYVGLAMKTGDRGQATGNRGHETRDEDSEKVFEIVAEYGTEPKTLTPTLSLWERGPETAPPPPFFVTEGEGEGLSLPLVYQHETVGELIIAPRAPGETYSAADRRLLRDLAHQAGIAVHATRLTADLQQVTVDLQRSRERLVLAREEERRRLRRDLHDGLGPTLAALALTASAVGDLMATDPQAAAALLAELQREIRGTVSDIRRLVYDLRPPALDELGLVAAIRESAAQLTVTGDWRLEIEAEEPLPPLPAAVEVAAYRIAQEALTNVARHAGATRCVVRLTVDDGRTTIDEVQATPYALRSTLHIEIVDNGVGLSAEHRAGVGLLSMRERAEELGGACVIEGMEPTGTRVRAWLPLGKETADGAATDTHRG
jgi:signal transduction histidine kinase